MTTADDEMGAAELRAIAARASLDQSSAEALDLLGGLAAHLDTVDQADAVAMLADTLERMSLDRSAFALIAANYAIKTHRAQLVDPDADGRHAAHDALRGRLAGLGAALADTPWWNVGQRGRILDQLARLARTELEQFRR